MPLVSACPVPESSLLAPYALDGGFVDAYETRVPASVSLEHFVAAFYTSRLFRFERSMIRWLARRPSTDAEVEALAAGTGSTFAVWSVEARTGNELLLADETGRTRSWLKVAASAGTAPAGTALFFGSAVTPRVDARTGEKSMGPAFAALLGFHRAYSRALLRAAAASLGP